MFAVRTSKAGDVLCVIDVAQARPTEGLSLEFSYLICKVTPTQVLGSNMFVRRRVFRKVQIPTYWLILVGTPAVNGGNIPANSRQNMGEKAFWPWSPAVCFACLLVAGRNLRLPDGRSFRRRHVLRASLSQFRDLRWHNSSVPPSLNCVGLYDWSLLGCLRAHAT